MPRTDGLIVGVVGATGMVGRELLALLERRRFPVRELRPFSSGQTKSAVRFRGGRVDAPGPDRAALAACDVVFLVSSDAVSREHAPFLAKAGVWVIDDSAAFRLDPTVPLIIPEVNASALRRDRRLIAGPNCTMTGLAVAAARLHAAAGVRVARIASYQAVSGAGKAALGEFFSQNAGRRLAFLSDGRAPVLPEPKATILPRAISANVVPQVGRFDRQGRSSEENKVAAELRKVWNAPKMKVSVTAVRVPTVRGHALAVWLTLGKTLTPARAKALMKRTPGLLLSRDGDYPTPLSAAGRGLVHAGRVRAGATPRELALWVVSDNLLKGAALNSVQVAEELVRRRWLKRR